MKWPALRVIRTRYADLAGVLLRDWERDHCLVAYYHRPSGFHLVAVRPRWRWLLRLVCGYWLGEWRVPPSWAQVVWHRRGRR